MMFFSVMSKKNYRQSNFELLRIISMLLIISSHYAIHGKIDMVNMLFSTNKELLLFLSYGGKLGVNLFLLISGFFLIDKKFKILQLLKLCIVTSFFYILFEIIIGGNYYVSTIVKSIFPIGYNYWWFITTYCLLYIFSDFINLFILSLDKKKFKIFILMLFLITSIMPTFLFTDFGYSNLLRFIFIYSIGAYIRLYLNKDVIIKNSLLKGIGIYILMLLLSMFIDLLGIYIPFFQQRSTYFSGMTKTPMLICSVLIFIGFKNLEIGPNKFINCISSTTLITYLIHDNSIARTMLWKNIFNNSVYINSYMMIVHAFFSIILVFGCCTLIGLVYINCIEPILINFLIKLLNKLKYLIKKIKNILIW